MTLRELSELRKFCQTSQHLPGRCLSKDGGKGVSRRGAATAAGS